MDEESLFGDTSSGPVGPAADATDDLADVLHMPALEFAELFGASWRPTPGPTWHDYDSDPSGGEGYPVTPWWMSGEPPQLMIRVFPHGVFIAVPEGEWLGHELTYQPGLQRYVARHQLERAPEHVAEMLRIRRRSFRYCRFCRQQTGKERRVDDDVCMGCASAWHGTVF